MAFNFKTLPYIYFALLATGLLVKNFLHPAIEVDWTFLIDIAIVIIFILQVKLRFGYGDLILGIVTLGYSCLLFLSAYSATLKEDWSWKGEYFILIPFLLLNFYASITIFINGAERAH